MLTFSVTAFTSYPDEGFHRQVIGTHHLELAIVTKTNRLPSKSVGDVVIESYLGCILFRPVLYMNDGSFWTKSVASDSDLLPYGQTMLRDDIQKDQIIVRSLSGWDYWIMSQDEFRNYASALNIQ